MQKLGLKQHLIQKLSPQQIQFIKLLQVTSADMKARIAEELEANPVLEKDERIEAEDNESALEDEVNIDDYLRDDDYTGYKMWDGSAKADFKQDGRAYITTPHSLNEQLLDQLSFLGLTNHQHLIGQHLIGSIEGDGYIRRDLNAIVDDLAFTQNIETNLEEVEAVLDKIQSFDPPGIGARNLQECLLVQLRKRKKHDVVNQLAISIVEECFDEFTKKHYDKISKKLGITNHQVLKEALGSITKLNPKPGNSSPESASSQVLYPDFIVTKQNEKLEVSLSTHNAPELKIRKNYANILETYHKHDKKDKKLKETVSFVKQKLETAKWFIDAIKQRQQTLLTTMRAIVKLQYDFFMEEEESKLKPMILRDVAEEIEMDVSTVSRVVSNKSVQTELGTYPLKFFFSEAISTPSGEDVSNRAIKKAILEIIKAEAKNQPYTDEKIVLLLKKKDYKVARRTVAKYREQLNIPVARLRKEI